MTIISWFTIEREAVGKLILRVAIAAFILVYGVEKITNPAMMPYIMGLLGDIGLPSFIAYGVYIGEIVAPMLVIIGWRSKIAAAIMSLTMLVVILLGHTDAIFPLSEFSWWGIELQTLFLVNCLVVMCLGAGKFALSSTSIWD